MLRQWDAERLQVERPGIKTEEQVALVALPIPKIGIGPPVRRDEDVSARTDDHLRVDFPVSPLAADVIHV